MKRARLAISSKARLLSTLNEVGDTSAPAHPGKAQFAQHGGFLGSGLSAVMRQKGSNPFSEECPLLKQTR